MFEAESKIISRKENKESMGGVLPGGNAIITFPQCDAEFEIVEPHSTQWSVMFLCSAQKHAIFTYQITSKPFRNASETWSDPKMSAESGVVSLRKLCEEQTFWQTWSTANYSIQIHKRWAKLRDWHQFPTGQPAQRFLFSPSIYP